MPPAEHTHSPTPEEIMEYLDGEGTASSRAAVAAHLASCATCESVASEQRRMSEDAGAWTVAPAPGSLRAPAFPPARVLHARVPAWRPSRLAMGALGMAAAVLIVVAVGFRTSHGRRPIDARAVMESGVPLVEPPARSADASAAPGSAPLAGQTTLVSRDRAGQWPAASALLRTPMVIRTATLQIVAKDFGGVRLAVEAIVSQAGGFIDQMTITGDTSTARALRATLRVPGARLPDALVRLRQIGQVIEDTQGSQDVTDQIVDLEARLASARATEQRLTDLLRNRTGKLSDVLDVERELARVRLDIERLDAEKANMGRRVTYATIGIHIAEERKAGLDTGPLSLATRTRIAAADGLEAAMESVAWTLLFLLRAGPSLLLWGVGVALGWRILRRRLRLGIRDSR